MPSTTIPVSPELAVAGMHQSGDVTPLVDGDYGGAVVARGALISVA